MGDEMSVGGLDGSIAEKSKDDEEEPMIVLGWGE
jgi:hypothetical protein